MPADRIAKDFESLSGTDVRAREAPGRRAIDAWENEGGSANGAVGARDLARTALAGNAGWRASNSAGWLANHPASQRTPKASDEKSVDDEDDRIIRYLGAAVIMQWNTIPTKLQRELFDNASAMGELLQTDVLKGQIARFLHKHKDDGEE